MPVKSEKQRRAMGAALRGKSTLGIPRKVAREYLGKADGGLTGSAGRAAPTIATSARHYADGGQMADDALSRRLQAYKDQLAKTRAKRAARAEKARTGTAPGARRTGKTAAELERAARITPTRSVPKRTSRSQGASGPKRLPPTKRPKQPAKVTVGRDGSVTTTRRSPTGTTTTKRTPRGPTGAARKTTAKQATSRSGPEKRRGTRRRAPTGLKGVLSKLTKMNKAAVARARAHGNRD